MVILNEVFLGMIIVYTALVLTALFGSPKWSDRAMRLITSRPGPRPPRGRHRWWPWT